MPIAELRDALNKAIAERIAIVNRLDEIAAKTEAASRIIERNGTDALAAIAEESALEHVRLDEALLLITELHDRLDTMAQLLARYNEEIRELISKK